MHKQASLLAGWSPGPLAYPVGHRRLRLHISSRNNNTQQARRPATSTMPPRLRSAARKREGGAEEEKEVEGSKAPSSSLIEYVIVRNRPTCFLNSPSPLLDRIDDTILDTHTHSGKPPPSTAPTSPWGGKSCRGSSSPSTCSCRPASSSGCLVSGIDSNQSGWEWTVVVNGLDRVKTR